MVPHLLAFPPVESLSDNESRSASIPALRERLRARESVRHELQMSRSGQSGATRPKRAARRCKAPAGDGPLCALIGLGSLFEERPADP
jgi:hypothetical protein